MFQYSQNIFFFLISEKTKCSATKKDPSVTISGLQKQQGVERTLLRLAKAAHLFMTLSCKTDVKKTPALCRCEKNDSALENDPSFKFLSLRTLGSFSTPRHV